MKRLVLGPMANPSKIVEDGLATQEVQQGAGPRWAWLAAGVAIGAAVALLLSGLTDSPADPDQENLLEIARAEPGGTGDMILGFPDGIAAITSKGGASLEEIVWPLARPATSRPIPLATTAGPDPIGYDVSGRYVFALRPVLGEGRLALFAGSSSSVGLIATGVSGAAWHDSEPRQLAYSRPVEGATEILETDVWSGRTEFMASLPGEQRVVGYGDWGMALQQSDNEVVTLFSDEGLYTVDGRFLGSSHKGMLAVFDGQISVITPQALPVGAFFEVPTLGDPLVAQFSPDGEMIAIQGNSGFGVFTTVYKESVVGSTVGVGSPVIVWSSDGRFALTPGDAGVIVLDTEEGFTELVLDGELIHGITVIPTID